jgi:hypothetical protein
MQVTKVISGGQTGIDQLGLKVAKFLGIPTGGTAPKGFRTELGPCLSLRDEYNLVESNSESYTTRTEQNVVDSDGTVLFGDMTSAGSQATLFFINKHNKPHIVNPTSIRLKDWLKESDIKILNVAGNRGSKVTTPKLLEYRDILITALKT